MVLHLEAGLNGLFLVILLAGIYALILVGWCWAFFLLMNTKKWYYELFAVIMTGIFGAILLIGLQWVYHKLGLRFLD